MSFQIMFAHLPYKNQTFLSLNSVFSFFLSLSALVKERYADTPTDQIIGKKVYNFKYF